MSSTRLEELRRQLDATDEALVRTLCLRLSIIDEVARVKGEEGLPTRDAAREAALLARVQKYALELGAAPEGVAIVSAALNMVVVRCRGLVMRRAPGMQKALDRV